MTLKWLIAPVVVYGAFVALVYVAQRLLQYFPERRRTAPAAIGLADAEEVGPDTADGERVIVWHVPPRNGHPVFVYFHGNGGSLSWREERFRDLIDDGSGLVALSYRGYGGSSGRPTEKGLIEDAKATYAFATARYPAERLVLWGESLGSALAVALAADNRVGCLVLEAPFTSAVDVGAQHYWFMPVRLLMRDQFRSDLRIGKVRAPVLGFTARTTLSFPSASVSDFTDWRGCRNASCASPALGTTISVFTRLPRRNGLSPSNPRCDRPTPRSTRPRAQSTFLAAFGAEQSAQ
jgi:uncharacterized protein